MFVLTAINKKEGCDPYTCQKNQNFCFCLQKPASKVLFLLKKKYKTKFVCVSVIEREYLFVRYMTMYVLICIPHDK